LLRTDAIPPSADTIRADIMKSYEEEKKNDITGIIFLLIFN
jgi:hypothetical protein